MTQRSNNVLRVNTVEEQTAYRSAIARIIINIQRDHGVTQEDIAEAIDVSVGTVANASNKRTDLSAVYLKRLGQAYGPTYLDPYSALFEGRTVPLKAEESDALPPLTAAIHKIALARAPESPGGVAEVHTELLEMLPDLRAAQRAINWMIMKAERAAA